MILDSKGQMMKSQVKSHRFTRVSRRNGFDKRNLILMYQPSKLNLSFVLNTNVQSLHHKVDDLQATCDNNEVDLAVITES